MPRSPASSSSFVLMARARRHSLHTRVQPGVQCRPVGFAERNPARRFQITGGSFMIVGVPEKLSRGAACWGWCPGNSHPRQSRPRSCGRSGRGARLATWTTRRAKGASIIPIAPNVFRAADIVIPGPLLRLERQNRQGRPPALRRNGVLIGFLRPLGSRTPSREIAAKGVTSSPSS